MTSNSSASSMNGWGPYSGARDFNRSMLIIVFILVFVIFFFLFLRATSRFLYSLRTRRAQMQVAMSDDDQLKEQIEAVVPTRQLVFSQGIMGEATSASECAICLCEFVEGDGLRVLPNCKHWFHESCIEVWLTCGGSCPTCRTSCVTMAKDEPEKR
ncbi:hypothetical protein IEQ34_005602 [Dendrobium chrysotoxum]|uniref:RING-type E3 ubiquitin transferase n=1 Tax=Dendrobium chrysotoxum TaxID=161865 RepID=A0AAV7HCQ4_DENCH|nr:hypothetical protein IEQ34_005602 [Dendrobium chrysotoxum]